MDMTSDQKKTCFFEETQKKTCWPEFVGLSITQAVPSILKDMPNAEIEVLALSSPMTHDFRPNRVRIFVDTVAQTPMVG
ncbi:unnamed protein product [Miscanthus lutarioriparius]|uniref:Uncharacterized protein n=1 Tax=Miscanthus lutarioriparius TaxID=422564 RepID=A0A811RY66_9POAL|nr:unnamed protein product [Miscanthus lutarioriparius]